MTMSRAVLVKRNRRSLQQAQWQKYEHYQSESVGRHAHEAEVQVVRASGSVAIQDVRAHDHACMTLAMMSCSPTYTCEDMCIARQQSSCTFIFESRGSFSSLLLLHIWLWYVVSDETRLPLLLNSHFILIN